MRSDIQYLVYWLANEDVYTSDYVRKWIESTPREEAAGVLAELANMAQPEPRSFWYGMFRAYMVAFGTSDSVNPKGPAGRKAGTRAGMLLANMGDPRAIPPLVRVFETEWHRLGKYQAAIESSLIRVLGKTLDLSDQEPYVSSVRELAFRLWRSGQGQKELSTRHTELLSASLTWLEKPGGEDEMALFNTIAQTPTSTPHRRRIKDEAVALLNRAA